MAKTIMIANDVYRELKQMKRHRSFSQTIRQLMEKTERKTAGELRDCLGLLPRKDNEYDVILKESRKQFRKWRRSA